MELFNNQDSSPGPDEGKRSDAQIRTDILRLFAENDYLKDRNIRVTVDHGAVQLEGTVFTRQSWERAQDLAADVRGVEKIQNQIKVEPGPGYPPV